MTQNEYIYYDLIKCSCINKVEHKKINKKNLFKNNLVIICIDCNIIIRYSTNKHEFPQQFLQ